MYISSIKPMLCLHGDRAFWKLWKWFTWGSNSLKSDGINTVSLISGHQTINFYDVTKDIAIMFWVSFEHEKSVQMQIDIAITSQNNWLMMLRCWGPGCPYCSPPLFMPLQLCHAPMIWQLRADLRHLFYNTGMVCGEGMSCRGQAGQALPVTDALCHWRVSNPALDTLNKLIQCRMERSYRASAPAFRRRCDRCGRSFGAGSATVRGANKVCVIE